VFEHRDYATTIFRAISHLEVLNDYQVNNEIEIVPGSDIARAQRDLKPIGEYHDKRHDWDK
jgi:hypothetical protein